MIVQLEAIKSHFSQSFHALDTSVPQQKVSNLSYLVYYSMTSGRRNFHNAQHILDICEGMHAIQILAGLFHDLVYYQVDDGLPPLKKALLLDYIILNRDKTITINLQNKDVLFELCLCIFGFKSGQSIGTQQGLNEFLSAFIAVKSLAPYLSFDKLTCIVCCIEGTIPFRATPFVQLEQKLKKANELFLLNLTQVEVNRMIKLSVELANKDVINFANEDIGVFLANTWALMPETNDFFLEDRPYFITNYRQALQKVTFFFRHIRSEHVFHQYENTPKTAEYELMTQTAAKNVTISYKYLVIKLVTITIIEALARSTGGDVPLYLFTGNLRKEGDVSTRRAEDFLEQAVLKEELEYDFTVLQLLDKGRATATSFDMKNAPYASYIYKMVGEDVIHTYFYYANLYFSNEISTQGFLRLIDKRIVSNLAYAFSNIVKLRKNALIELAMTEISAEV